MPVENIKNRLQCATVKGKNITNKQSNQQTRHISTGQYINHVTEKKS